MDLAVVRASEWVLDIVLLVQEAFFLAALAGARTRNHRNSHGQMPSISYIPDGFRRI